jgi:hypothetical protein
MHADARKVKTSDMLLEDANGWKVVGAIYAAVCCITYVFVFAMSLYSNVLAARHGPVMGWKLDFLVKTIMWLVFWPVIWPLMCWLCVKNGKEVCRLQRHQKDTLG